MERKHPVRDDRLPVGVPKARRWLAREGADGTKALRQAMLHHQVMFQEMIGRPASTTDEAPAARREMA
jgi:hypothetical protein